MNIFYLDEVPGICAQYHCDKHVVKMIVEYAQLLSTAHRLIDGTQIIGRTKTGRRAKRWQLPDDREDLLYKATHVNHPSAQWCRLNTSTYSWTLELFSCCLKEYTYRYGKVHATQRLLPALSKYPDRLEFGSWCTPPPAMGAYPQCIVPGDSLTSYRNYYREAKAGFARWTDRPIPAFMLSC